MSDHTGKAGLFRVCAGAALALSVALGSASAAALTDEERAGARAAATEGAKAFAERRFTDAVDLFTRAESLVHSPVHLLFLARARAELGQLVEARESYLKVTREQVAPDAPAAFSDAKTQAQSELAKLEPRLPYVTVSVQGRGANEVVVKMDGIAIPPALVGVPRPVNPGEHAFQAFAQGRESTVTKVAVKEGGRETVVLTIEEAAGAAAPGAAASPTAAPPGATAPVPGGPAAADHGTSKSGMRIASYASFGVGAVGLGVGIGFLLSKNAKQDDSDKLFQAWKTHCPGEADCASAEAEIKKLDDQAATAGTISTVGFILGGVGIAGGVTLLLLSSGSEEKTAAPAPHVTPWVGFGSAGLSGTF